MGDAKFQENTAKQADLYVKVRPGYDIPLFSAMRTMLRGHELNEFTEEVTGVDVKTIKKLTDMLLDSEFVGAFIGLGLASSRRKDKKMIEVVLNTGSTVRQGAVIKGGMKMTDEYVQEAAYCELNPKDMAQVGHPEKVKVSTEVGDVTVYARIDDGVSVGEAFIPRGPWANTIISSKSDGCLSAGASIDVFMLNHACAILGCQLEDDIFVTAETTKCLPDAATALANCTIGNKRLLRIADYGKMALSMTKRDDPNGIRIIILESSHRPYLFLFQSPLV